jgi:hypothetical protein
MAWNYVVQQRNQLPEFERAIVKIIDRNGEIDDRISCWLAKITSLSCRSQSLLRPLIKRLYRVISQSISIELMNYSWLASERDLVPISSPSMENVSFFPCDEVESRFHLMHWAASSMPFWSERLLSFRLKKTDWTCKPREIDWQVEPRRIPPQVNQSVEIGTSN